jgi:DNA-binding beta-propeller fold protein YncE
LGSRFLPLTLGAILGVCAVFGVLPSGLQAQTPPTGEVVWPRPPETPRIRYAGYVHSELDVGKERSFGDKVKSAVLGTRNPMIGLRRPHDVYVDQRSRILVTDKARQALVVFDPASKSAELWGQEGLDRLKAPMGVGGDGQGRIYVTDPGTQRVVVYDESGGFVDALGGKDVLLNPVDVVVDSARDRVYVIDSRLHQVVVFNQAGEVVDRIGRDAGELDPEKADDATAAGHGGRRLTGPLDVIANRSSEPGEFRFPVFAALDRDGTLYVTDALNSRIQVFGSSGEYLWEIGKAGDAPGSFGRPKGVAIDSEGHVYVADASFSNVQVFDSEGTLLLVFGDMGRGGGQLWFPEAVHIDMEDRIYVVDAINSRVQIFEYLANPTSQASAESERRNTP